MQVILKSREGFTQTDKDSLNTCEHEQRNIFSTFSWIYSTGIKLRPSPSNLSLTFTLKEVSDANSPIKTYKCYIVTVYISHTERRMWYYDEEKISACMFGEEY